MSDRVLLPLPDGRWLALAPDVFREGLAAGAEFGRPSAEVPSDVPLLDAQELAKELKVPPTRIEEAARRGEIPSIRCGRYVRFDLRAVKAALAANGSAS